MSISKHRPIDNAGRSILAYGLAAVAVICMAAGKATNGYDPNLARRLRQGPGVSNHPVGVMPSAAIQIPEGWPLDASGSLTCTTCHQSLPALDGSGGSQLRGGPELRRGGPAFCATCHTDDGAPGGTNHAHWQAIGLAHPRDDRRSARTPRGGLDRESRSCLSCHDGLNAPDASHSGTGKLAAGWADPRGRSHPVGVRYSLASSRPATTRLKPPGSLPPTVRLPDGAVSCVSCHDLYAGTPGLLTVPIERSQLCLTCHDMD